MMSSSSGPSGTKPLGPCKILLVPPEATACETVPTFRGKFSGCSDGRSDVTQPPLKLSLGRKFVLTTWPGVLRREELDRSGVGARSHKPSAKHDSVMREGCDLETS